MEKNNIQIDMNKEKNNIIIKINNNIKEINHDFIVTNITPNFSVEMFYYVMRGFIKYANYKLIKIDNDYIFEGYYIEPYDQGDEIHIKFII